MFRVLNEKKSLLKSDLNGQIFARVKAFSTFLQYCIIDYKSSQVTANDKFRPPSNTYTTHTYACTHTRDVIH